MVLVTYCNIRADRILLMEQMDIQMVLPMLQYLMIQLDILIKVGVKEMDHCNYLEPWHSDIFDFLELKKNHGNELERREIYFTVFGFLFIYETS